MEANALEKLSKLAVWAWVPVSWENLTSGAFLADSIKKDSWPKESAKIYLHPWSTKLSAATVQSADSPTSVVIIGLTFLALQAALKASMKLAS